MRAITPLQKPAHVDVCVPGSKSYTHRMLIAAALSGGACTIQDALDSEDTTLTLAALSKWGVAVERSGSTVAVTGRGGGSPWCWWTARVVVAASRNTPPATRKPTVKVVG